MTRLPGADVIEHELEELARGDESIEALLLLIGAPPIGGLGLPV